MPLLLPGSTEREALYRLAATGLLVDGAALPPAPRQPCGGGSDGAGGGAGGSSAACGQPNSGSGGGGGLAGSWDWASVEPRYGAAWEDGDLESYFEALAAFHFVLSPRGNGLDCFRTWEALALGTVGGWGSSSSSLPSLSVPPSQTPMGLL